MRDGIQLAATVRYPYGGTCSATAPCPRSSSIPATPSPGPPIRSPSLLPQARHPRHQLRRPGPAARSATDVGAVLARVAGFATVSLQMRAPGVRRCFDLFGYPSDYDAYDAVEVVAHQDWVANHKVGMVGISYSGLSQLPSAGTDPPDLAAIAPMSPTDDLFSTGYPGGIYNNGFAAGWIADRIDDAKPAAALSGGRLVPLATTPVSGVGPALGLLRDRCRTGRERGSLVDLPRQSGPPWPIGEPVDPRRSPARGAGHRTRPGPLALRPSLDERMGDPDQCARLHLRRAPGRADRSAVAGPPHRPTENHTRIRQLVNGEHIDSTDPQILSRWLEFLDIYVADKVPTAPNGNWAASSMSSRALPREHGPGPSPRGAVHHGEEVGSGPAQFASQTPHVGVLFDNGGGAVGAGDPQSTYSASFAQWPPAGTVATDWLRAVRNVGCRSSEGAREGGSGPSTPMSARRRACPRRATPGRPTPAGTGQRSRRRTGSHLRRRRSSRTPPSWGRPPSSSGWRRQPGRGPSGDSHRGPPRPIRRST